MPFTDNVLTALTGDTPARLTGSWRVEFSMRGSRQLTIYGSESVLVRCSRQMGMRMGAR